MFKKELPRVCAAITARFAALAFCAALVFGVASCSNSSGDNNAALLAAAGTGANSGSGNGTGSGTGSGTGTGTNSGANTGTNAGTNIFAGKTFKGETSPMTGVTYTNTFKFEAQKCTLTSLQSMMGSVTECVYNYEYSCDEKTKQLFLKLTAEGKQTVYINNGVRTVEPDTFKDDADFVDFGKKIIGDNAQNIRNLRKYNFTPYGYSDDTGATEVSSEVIQKYNAARLEEKTKSAKLCTIFAYDLSESTLKLKSDSRIPKGKGLNEIFGAYDVSMSTSLTTTLQQYQLRYSTNYYSLGGGPDIYLYNLIGSAGSSTGYKVSSITENAINISATATGSGSVPSVIWTYTPASQSFSYTTNKTDTGATFVIDTLGTINVTYASENNVPDFSSNNLGLGGAFDGTYTQQ